MGLSTIATLTIFLLSLKKGENSVVLADWLSLSLAAIALAMWFITKRPLLSVILIAVIDAVGGFFPTFRKSFHKPHQETASLYLIYALSLSLSLVALRNFDAINALYPASFVFINTSMVIFLWVRRRQLDGQ
jgi:hypothetical protein